MWHHCGARNIDKIEKIQFRALRFVFSDYVTPYEALLLRANMPSLEVRRLRVIALEVFKATDDLSPGQLHERTVYATDHKVPSTISKFN